MNRGGRIKKDILVFNLIPRFELTLTSHKNTHIRIFLSLVVMTVFLSFVRHLQLIKSITYKLIYLRNNSFYKLLSWF